MDAIRQNKKSADSWHSAPAYIAQAEESLRDVSGPVLQMKPHPGPLGAKFLAKIL